MMKVGVASSTKGRGMHEFYSVTKVNCISLSFKFAILGSSVRGLKSIFSENLQTDSRVELAPMGLRVIFPS